MLLQLNKTQHNFAQPFILIFPDSVAGGRALFPGLRTSISRICPNNIALNPVLLSDCLSVLKAMKVKSGKKSVQLRHAPLGAEIEKPVGKLRPPKPSSGETGNEDFDEDEGYSAQTNSLIAKQARDQRFEITKEAGGRVGGDADDAQRRGFDSDQVS